MTLDIELLDTLVPLRGASFRDVVGAGIDLPLRYSEFFVYLNDGTKARPRNPGQLLGYGMRGDHVNFYFRSGAEVVGIGVVAERQRPILAVEYWGPLKACRSTESPRPGRRPAWALRQADGTGRQPPVHRASRIRSRLRRTPVSANAGDSRLEGHPRKRIDTTLAGEMSPMERKRQIDALEFEWANNSRWTGVERSYSAADVVNLRGSVLIEQRSRHSVPESSGSCCTGTSRFARSGR